MIPSRQESVSEKRGDWRAKGGGGGEYSGYRVKADI